MHHVLHHFRAFAHEHDDMPAFTAVYLVGTILVAALLSLGWFAIFIGVHMCLDVIKYRDLHGFTLSKTIKAVFLESVADIALFLTAMTFAVYLHHTFLLASVSGLLRSELTVIRALGMLIPETSIVQHMVVTGMNFHEYMHSVHPDVALPLSRVQRWSILTLIVTIVLLLLAVPILGAQNISVLPIIAEEMHLAL